MGCCCAKSDEVQENEGERSPLLSEKHLTADTVTAGGETPTKTGVTQDAEPEPEKSKNEGSDAKVPDDITPSPVDLKRLQIPEQDEKMEAAVLRYHNHLNNYHELQKIISRIREMYLEDNKDQTISGCFAHVCDILGTRFTDVLFINETDPTCVQLTYDKQRIPETALPALEAFNKASRLVKDLLHEDPLLAVAIDDVIFAENVTRADITKMSKDKDPSVVSQCLDHYLYDIRQFYYIKTMLEKIKDETHSIHSQLHEAAQEIRTKRSGDDSVAVTDDLVKLESASTQPSEVIVSGDKEDVSTGVTTPQTTATADKPGLPAAEQHSDVSSSSQVAAEAAQTPDVSASEKTPDVSAAEKTPDVSAAEKTPDVSAAEKTPDVSAAEKTPDVSAAEKTPVVSAAEKTPDVSAAEKTPGVSAAEKTPDVSAGEKTPDVSAGEKTPDVSAAEKTPVVSAGEKTPDVSAVEKTPDVSAAEKTSDVSAAEKTPDVSAAEKTPDVSAAEKKPDVSAAQETPDVSVTDVSVGEKTSDHAPDVSHDNLSPGDNSMDQRTADTTLEITADISADISADFRTDESGSLMTDEGEVSYTSNEEFDATRESLTDSKSFIED